MSLQKLPIGISTLALIRDNAMLYIDKTPFVWQMVQQPARFFLSRPRRFGKSLLLNTFKELFEGNQRLFDGLYIAERWDWSQRFPVIQLNFADGVMQSRAELDVHIEEMLIVQANRLNLDLTARSISGRCAELIMQARQQYSQKVVVLVDEYDKPILDNIEHPERAAEIREGLKNLYSVLKGQDEHLQFVFMTGVTKFSKVSLFSGLNQLQDITLSPAYATICGYTQTDLETQFAEHLQGVDWAQLKTWYNGYQFLGEAVYNPYDILLFISEQGRYRNYWFETGSPSFLIKLFRQNAYFLPELENLNVSEEILDSFDIESIDPVTLLFQAGYLTIVEAYMDLGELTFKLTIPNHEVRVALSNHLIQGYTDLQSERRTHRHTLYQALRQGDLETLKSAVQRLFAAIPWRNFTKNDLPNSEGYYASVLYAFFASIQAVIIPEDISNRGQADLTVQLGDMIYVMEIKLDTSKEYQTQTPNSALQQIQTKAYSQKYQGLNKTVFEVGLIFNSAQRNLVQMDWTQR